MFVKLNKIFAKPLYTTVNDLESWAGIDGKGVHHKKIWSPDSDQLYSVIPKQYWGDFELTVMTINSILLPHRDNDLITTINFYIQPGNYRTVFYTPKDNAEFTQPKVEVSGTEVPLEQQIGYVKAVYQFDNVDEVGSFIANPNEAYLLDVREIHTVIPIGETLTRKALGLRTKKYVYDEVLDMLNQTGHI